MGRGLGPWILFAAWGCAPPPAVVPNLPPRSADQATRQQAYDRHHLEYESGVFSRSWRRADGEYQFVQLTDLAKTYPETEDVVSRAQTRGLVLGAIGGAGGGIIGYTLGYNLTADSSQRMSDDTQVALYGTGAGLIVLGLCIGAFWHNPIDDFADVYNRNLRRELGLPPPPSRDARAVLVPRPLGFGEFGWVF